MTQLLLLLLLLLLELELLLLVPLVLLLLLLLKVLPVALELLGAGPVRVDRLHELVERILQREIGVDRTHPKKRWRSNTTHKYIFF